MPINICFFILPHTNLMDFGAAAQAFYEAKEQDLALEISYCSYEENIITATGLPLGKIQNYQTQKLQKGDYLIVLSADYRYIFSPNFNPDTALLNWLEELHQKGIIICSICNGAFLLGKAGLLNGRKCTTHWKRTAQLQQYFPKAKVQENVIFVEDNNIYTSAGASSAVDVSLHILMQIKNEFFSHKVARELVVYNRRNGSEAQYSVYFNNRNHLHIGIHKAQDYLQTNLQHKITIPELAEYVNMSYRNFCRIFKKETSLTVGEYITLLRKERIKELCKNPNISRSQIAKQCGLLSERQVSRIMKC